MKEVNFLFLIPFYQFFQSFFLIGLYCFLAILRLAQSRTLTSAHNIAEPSSKLSSAQPAQPDKQ